MLAALREVMRAAPIYTPRMPKSGKPMSVRMTNCGALGWVTDERGYRYQPLHIPGPPGRQFLTSCLLRGRRWRAIRTRRKPA
jgi:alkylated DNA repair dioxygenase AlkB